MALTRNPSAISYTETETTPGELRWVNDRLIDVYGTPPRDPLPFGNKPDPLDELIYITLGQRTHSAGTAQAFNALKERFPTWDLAAAASVTEIAALINPSGLAALKAPRVVRMLADIQADRGTCDLSFLRWESDEDAYRYLAKRLRAGYKTALCVMLYALGREVFPADTHALRVLRRLGLITDQPRHETVNRHINKLVPPDIRYPLHVNLILHGRAVCSARPQCHVCTLRTRCAYAQKA